MELIANRPLLGYGFDGLHSSALSRAEQIHNLWLRLGVQSGLLAPLVFASVVISVLLRSVRHYRETRTRRNSVKTRSVSTSLPLVLVAGLVISMFEPNTLLGTFQTSAIWWASAGAACGYGTGNFSSPPETQVSSSRP